MNRKYLFVILFLVIFGCNQSVKAQINRVDKPFILKDLSGVILAPNDEPLVGCTVERLIAGWKKEIKSVTTNLNGKFRFSKLPFGTFYLRISCPMFQTYEIKVLTNQKSKRKLELNLELAI